MPREWRELRHKDGIRVYTQRSKKSRDPDAPVPLLLLFGTIRGTTRWSMIQLSYSYTLDFMRLSQTHWRSLGLM
ncbi:hypothetical protein PF002_g9502 [Phytophthora fragariae]|uniref:Uncharacterized protein n=1 Tax=Phytophthora fragariae TaxID=53985 RepID=A0A6A3S431_9STRA|nr:hypothetical protein PF007_g13510 [Phytophthora fragariae]KAE9240940.1 hypothetical protein PF002_g9502 [Phytophthora fragariae]